jgi:hypothetical protein
VVEGAALFHPTVKIAVPFLAHAAGDIVAECAALFRPTACIESLIESCRMRSGFTLDGLIGR